MLTANGGAAISGAASNINNNSNFATNVNTGTSTGTITLGGGASPLAINSTNFDVTAAGALSGITGYNQASGNFAIAGAGTFATGTGAVGLNGNTTVTGTLGVTGLSTLAAVNAAAITTTGNFSQTGATTFSTGTGLVALNGNTTVTGTLGVTSTSTFTGLLTANGGATVSAAAINLNNNSNFATNINTGTSTGTVSIGGGTAPLVINSTNFDVTAGGALSGITGYNQASGNFAIAGAGTFATGTGAVGLNGNTTVTGTLGVTGLTTLAAVNSGAITTTGNFSQTGATTFSTGTGLVTLNGGTSVTGINTFTVGTGATTLGGTLGVTGISTLAAVNSGAITTTGNFSQTGATTFSTGTGLVALNGNTTVTGTLGVTSTSAFTGLLSANGGATIRGLTVNTATATDDQLLIAAAAGGLARFNGTITSVDLTGARTYTLPDASGTFQLAPASGSYLVQVPTSTATNTISPAANAAVALTVNASTGSALAAAIINQSLAADGLQFNATNVAGTETNGLIVNRNGVGGTTTNGINITSTAGTLTNGLTLTSANGQTITNGINFTVTGTGTYTNLITSANFSVANSGALVAVGVNSGVGLVQGTGGLTLSGATNINNNANFATNINTGTSTGTVSIGGGTAPLVINSTNFDVTAGGALSGITGYNQASGNFAIAGAGTFATGTGAVGLNGNTTVTGTLGVTGLTTLAAVNSGAITTTGNFSQTGATTFSTGTGAITANGALTLANATVTTPNGLNFDANTLVLDALNNRIGINNATPGNQLSINTPVTADATANELIYTNANGNKGLVIQATAAQAANILELQRSTGVALATFSSTGQLTLGSDNAVAQAGLLTLNDATGANGFTSVLGTSALSASRAINLPDEAGTICIRNSTLCGYALIGPAAVQADATTNPSLFINKTGASGNLLTLQKGGTTVFSVLNSGALAIQTTATNAINVKNAGGTDYFNVDTNGGLVQIGAATVDGAATFLVLDSYNGGAADPAGGTNGASYYNTTTSKMRCFEGGAWKDCIDETSVVKTADQVITNSAAFTNDAFLTVAMVANSSYTFTAAINYSGTSAAAGFKYTFTAPAGAAVYLNTDAPTTAAANTVCNIAASGQTCTIAFAANFRGTIRLTGYVRTAATAGSLQLQFAQNTATAAQSVTVYQGSMISYRKTQ